MAYVPPALRKKMESANGSDDAPTKTPLPPSPPDRGLQRERLPKVEDIHEHFWPLDTPSANTVHSTLNSSASAPDSLRYLMLFKEANPRWQTEGIIFVKTNLHILPGAEKVVGQSNDEQSQKDDGVAADDALGKTRKDSKSEAPTSATDAAPPATSDSTQVPLSSEGMADPVAVFEQVGHRDGGFRFTGYYKIARLQFLEPHSEDLVRMLEQKFTIPDKFGHMKKRQRDPIAWKKSLEHRWAVMKLAKDEEVSNNMEAPDIKIVEGREPKPPREPRQKRGPQKSVNEMLREMRLGKSETDLEPQKEPEPEKAPE